MTHACSQCGNAIGITTVAMSWPSRIKCPRCGTRHGYRHAWLIGPIYLALLVAIVVGSQLFSHQFADVTNGKYTTSGMQLLIQFGGPLLALLLVAPAYALLMGRYATLRPQAARSQ